MSIICYEVNYKNFGKCICVENSIIKFMATLDFGPRIIYFSLFGEENVLFEDTDRSFTADNGKYGTWIAYGGHRVWRAPEIIPETYFPDNTAVKYKFENDTLELSQAETAFGKKFSIVCRFFDNNTVEIENRITNCLSEPQRFAPWSITSLTQGGTEIIPLCSKNTGFLPNRTISLWYYTDLYDKRFRICGDTAFLQQDPEAEKAFKMGFNITDGEVKYIVGNQTFAKCFGEYDPDFNYPDFKCNFETYTNKHFLECELVGDEREYQPSETASIFEKWQISKTSASDLSKLEAFRRGEK